MARKGLFYVLVPLCVESSQEVHLSLGCKLSGTSIPPLGRHWEQRPTERHLRRGLKCGHGQRAAAWAPLSLSPRVFPSHLRALPVTIFCVDAVHTHPISGFLWREVIASCWYIKHIFSAMPSCFSSHCMHVPNKRPVRGGRISSGSGGESIVIAEGKIVC